MFYALDLGGCSNIKTEISIENHKILNYLSIKMNL